MAEFGGDGAEVNARIIYWGIAGSGKSANVRSIYSKLRPDHRGELRTIPTRLDPTVTYDSLPIELGQIGGVRTRIQIISVPGAPEHAPTRKQLLDQADGIVFVVDTQRDRIDENIASLEELRGALASYGRALEEIPLVVQYNKRDQSDPYALEELHRKLSMRSVAAFEAVAHNGTAVLQTLTTVSKRVIRYLRERGEGERRAAAASPEPEPVHATPPPGVSQILDIAVAAPVQPATSFEDTGEESAAVEPEILFDEDHPDGADIAATAAQAEAVFEPSFRQATGEFATPTLVDEEPGAPATLELIQIESIGQASQTGPGTVRIPMQLRDETGRSVPITITVQIGPGVKESSG